MTDRSENKEVVPLTPSPGAGESAVDTSTDKKACPNVHYDLYQALGEIARSVKSLEFSCDIAQRQFTLMGNVSRHDEPLDDAIWKEVTHWTFDSKLQTLDTVKRELKVSFSAVEGALESLRGVFRAELKVKGEDRLQRHFTEAESLLAYFEQLHLEHQAPRQPYLIRQSALSDVLLCFPPVIDETRKLRTSIDRDGIHSHARVVLIEQEAVLIRVKAKLATWRDNPSQKMGTKLQTARRQLLDVLQELQKLRAIELRQCQKAGITFYNRAGPVAYSDMFEALRWAA